MNAQLLLEGLGVSQLEAQIYLRLLENGATSVRNLAGLTGRNRGVVYESLKSLVGLGLATYVQKGQRKTYAAASPEIIKTLIAERELSLRQLHQEAETIVPSLMTLDRHGLGEPSVSYFQDDEGVAAILRDVLATTDQLLSRDYRVYSSKALRQYIYRRFPSFTQRRITAGIFVRTIAVGEGGTIAELSERRWLPDSETDRGGSYTLIYGHKLALISLSADGTPYGVVIEEPGVAEMQRQIFDQLWGTLG